MRTYVRRYVAALLAIMIATGFIVAINALSSAAREGAGQAVAQQYGRADLAVSELGDPKLYASVADRAREISGITAVSTNWQAYGDVAFPDGPENISIGSVATTPALRWQKPVSGRLPTATGEMALSAKRAKDQGVAIGDVLTLNTPDGDQKYTVTGIVDVPNGPLKSVAYVPEAEFRTLGEIGYPVDMVVAAKGSSAGLRAQLKSVAGDGVVDTGASYRHDQRLRATQGIDIFQKLISVFAGISLFVGALVIANTFTILLAQRARDLALLRCVGVMRAQVARSVLAEGVLIGVVGSVLGIVFGFVIALIGVALTRNLSPDTPMGDPSLTIAAVVVPALLGIIVTAAGAYLPAQRASAQSPLSALHPQDVVELRSKAGAARLVTAGLLLATGGAGLMMGLSGSLAIGMLGGMLSFIGVLLMTPVLVPGAIRMLGPIARRLGLAGRLAHLNSLRNPRRTAATSTALLIGVTLITSVVVGAASISNKVNSALDLNHPLDLTATTSAGVVPNHVVDEIRKVDGVAHVAAVPGTAAQVGKVGKVTVLGADSAALSLVHGNTWLKQLKSDEIVLSGSMSAPGDTVSLRVGDKVQKLKVLYGTGLGDAAIVASSTLESMGAKLDTHAVWVRASEGADAGDVASAVRSVSQTADLDVSGGLLDRAEILNILDVVLAVTVGLLAVAVLIALIGVGNTLSLSVLERVRENSLLRALGLGPNGLRAMLALEALLMATVAAGLGVALGTTYAWFGVKTTSFGIFNSSPDLTMPWGQIAMILVVAALAGLVACVLPARRAARIQPAAGLVAD